MFKIISVALLLIAACLVAAIILRKIPQLSLIDIGAVPKPKEDEVKERILIERMQRRLEQIKKYLKIIASFLDKFFSHVRKIWSKLRAIEQQLLMRDKDKVVILLKEAETKLSQSPEEAEKTYLEIIKKDIKNIAAYNGLSEIYTQAKKWLEAKQVLRFLMKLDSKNFVKYAFTLAKIEMEEQNYGKAMKLAGQIIQKGVTEPRYLDFFIEAAIMEGNRQMAIEGLELLQKVNPENGKIVDFEKRINELVY